MIRSFLIVSFIFLFSYNSICQNFKWHSASSSVLAKRFETNLFLIKQKLVTDSLFNIYSDSAEFILENLSKDTAFTYSLLDYSSTTYDALISTTYRIPFVIKPLGWVSDYAHIFTEGEIMKLDSTLKKFEKETTNEIAIVTLDSTFTQNENFDSLVISIHNFWGVGKAIKNNGILIGISVSQRTIRISNGYGIEAKLSDEETKRIIDDIIVPEFKKGNYFIGLSNAIVVLMKKIA